MGWDRGSQSQVRPHRKVWHCALTALAWSPIFRPGTEAILRVLLLSIDTLLPLPFSPPNATITAMYAMTKNALACLFRTWPSPSSHGPYPSTMFHHTVPLHSSLQSRVGQSHDELMKLRRNHAFTVVLTPSEPAAISMQTMAIIINPPHSSPNLPNVGLLLRLDIGMSSRSRKNFVLRGKL
ncbi:predicted protein [Plenodomus lingam JN3]|uniref:Predicted protein n=1 Tax=Leptosphaeria maculans (strain JN3 / isolate v23.1.3 / race Av1-4-5-6-7-8) TaxID=985895 RepID=E4ZZX7_LEPMJ|nr:predicted protein [Plenodomus lingam JN3]CBX96837.1 predicted protein [Plenodomus lingam JN3]